MEKDPIECLSVGKILNPSISLQKLKSYLEGLFGGSFAYYKHSVYHYKPSQSEVIITL